MQGMKASGASAAQPRISLPKFTVRQKGVPLGRLTEDAKRVLSQMQVMPVATASKEGLPNVVPMTFVKTLDDSAVLIADNYMDKGARNLEENPHVAVCAWDLETKRAYQIKGTAEVHRTGHIFDETVAWVRESKPDIAAKAAVVVTVTNVFVCHSGADRGKDVVLIDDTPRA